MAQPLDTPVIVPTSQRFPTGHATIAQLRVGDSVFAGDGTLAKVADVNPVVQQPTLTLTLDNGEEVTVSTDHVFRAATTQMVRKTETPTPDDARIAELMREAASTIAAERTLTSASFEDLYGLDEVAENNVLDFLLGPVGFTADGATRHYPANEALIAVSDWLMNGRNAPWVLVTAQQLLETDMTWWLLSYAPRTFVVSDAARNEANAIVDSCLAMPNLSSGIVRGGDQYRRQAAVDALELRLRNDGAIDGSTWTVPGKARPYIIDLLRSVGRQVRDTGGHLDVSDSRHIRILDIRARAQQSTRSIVVDHPSQQFLSGPWLPTHNSAT